MKIVSLAVFVVLLSGCDKRAEEVRQSSNPNVPVETLFKHDGCTVYRFYDGGRDHYFSKCEGLQTQTIAGQSCGKNCYRDEVISNLQ